MAYYPRKKRLEKLQFVDQYVLKLIADGNQERLQEMARAGYANLNICDKKGKPATYLAKKHGHKELAEWLTSVGDLFVSTSLY